MNTSDKLCIKDETTIAYKYFIEALLGVLMYFTQTLCKIMFSIRKVSGFMQYLLGSISTI